MSRVLPHLSALLLMLVVCVAPLQAETNIDGGMLSSLLFTCKSCHGETLQGKYPNHVPALAGQLSSYLAQQLIHYRDGQRGAHADDVYGQQMALMVATISDEEITQLADYLAASAKADSSGHGCQIEPEARSKGQDIYQTCVACHGARAEGNAELTSPNLAILHPSYIAEQLKNYKLGLRGLSEDSAMQAFAQSLSDADIDQLSEYICVLSTDAEKN